MKTFATSISTILLPVLLLQNTATALRWTPTPKDGEVLYACAGRDVTLAWDYTVDAGDVVSSIEWTYEGRSHEMVAGSLHGTFFPTPSFSHRVELVSDAGLILKHATPGDAGNYSVTVTGHDSSGVSFSMRRTVLVQVADDLMTADHELHARQQPLVEYCNATNQWHAVLTCGRFTYAGDPPVSVEWLTPQGKTLPSTAYGAGLFKLLLPNPATGGNYTCRISPSALNLSCAHGQGHGQRASSVEVNELTTRLALMEAKQDRLQAEQQRLQAENVQKDTVNNELKTKVQTMQAELARVQTDLRNQSSSCQCQGQKAQSIAFSARPSGIIHVTSHEDVLNMTNVLLNEGGAYSSGTGLFTAPVSGTYYFSAMAVAVVDFLTRNPQTANLYLRTNGRAKEDPPLLSSSAYSDDVYLQSGSLKGVVHLRRGEQVWLTTDSSTDHVWGGGAGTAFSGFLLFVE